MTEENNRIVYNEVVEYIRGVLPDRNDYFKALEAYAQENHVPIIQPEVAQLMQTLIQLHRPKRVLEIGTAIGYSASIMAEYMTEGEIVSIEIRPNSHELAKANVAQMATDVKFNFLLGDAQEVLKEVEGTFDLVFIDASKGHYQAFLALCREKVKPGSLIVSDNILYKGMIAHDPWVDRRHKTIVKRMRSFIKEIMDDETMKTSILPIGDGVALSYILKG